MSWLAKKKPHQSSTQLIPADDIPHGNLVALAVQRGDDLKNITALMDLQERWEKNEARKAYVVAMNAFKKNPPTIFKDRHVYYKNRNGDVTEYDHSSLANVAATISEGLAEHGLSHRWDQEQLDGGQIRVTCVITHAMGHSESNFLQSGADQSGGKNSIQAIGSTVTYLQRYTLLSAVGLATQDMDNDGRGAGQVQPQNDKPAQTEPELLSVYPEQLFSANFSTWKDLIIAGRHTHDSIINKIESTYTLSTDQKNEIKGI